MTREIIKTDIIELNGGQIEGLPSNPRNWTVRELEKLKSSIVETPELLELRPPMVVRHGDKYVALGGNMRISAVKDLGYKEVLCIVLPNDLDPYKLKEITIKDNAQIGSWDFDALANEWSDYELADYGIPVPIVIPEGTQSNSITDGNAKEVDDRVSIEIELSSSEFDFVNAKLREIGPTAEDAVIKILSL